MIDAKELRIGNLFITNDNMRTLTPLTSRIIDTGFNHPSYLNEGFEPIPITVEWLLKFGFEKQTDVCGFKWYKGNFYILEVAKNSFYCDYCLVFAIDYIHQLQNLYYALTQKELE